MEREKVSRLSTIFLALISTLTFVIAGYGASTKTLYVSPAGVDNDTCGTSSADPCKTINYTLQNRVTPNTTIQLAAGTYKENVFIDVDKDLISLVGEGSTVCKIAAPSKTTGAVEVHGAKVSLMGLAITTGGGPGLYAGNAMVRVQQCTIQTSAPSSGVAADAANLQLEKVTIKSSNGPGVSSSFGSTLGLTSCKVSGCAMPAVMVTQNSTLSMEKCTVTGNNTSLSGALGAISVFGSSSAFLRGNTISANKGQGITVQSGSTLQLMGGNKVIGNGTATTLQPNFRAGIGIAFSSHADLNPWPQGTAADQISENGGAGILLMSKADLMIMGAVINGNQGDGVELHGDSTANFTSGAVITNNQGWGIGCYDKDNDSKIMGAPGTISGNTLGASKCLQY